MILVCILGIDGAGKTTLAQALVKRLAEHDRRAVYHYGRIVPFFSRALMALGRRVFLRRQNFWRDYSGYRAQKQQRMKNPLLRTLFAASVWTDLLIQSWWMRLKMGRRFDIMVLDRYVYDTLINEMAVHFASTPEAFLRQTRAALALVPKPDLLFYIRVPVETAFSRKDDIPDPSFLEERRNYYELLADQFDVRILDGLEPVAALTEQSVNAVMQQ
jgi:thymidylate kinase